MTTWFFLLIGLIIVGAVVFRAIRKATAIPVLKVRVGTTDGGCYIVDFIKMHPDTKDIEYVRIVLSLISKILYILGKNHGYQRDQILNFMEKVSNTNMTPNDVGQLFPLMTYAKKGEPKGRTIEGVLYFLNEREREIMTKVPMTFFHEQFINSVIAVVQIAVDHLDERHRKHLRNSLKSMIQIYQSGVNPSLIKNIHIVPNQAFWIQYFTSM